MRIWRAAGALAAALAALLAAAPALAAGGGVGEVLAGALQAQRDLAFSGVRRVVRMRGRARIEIVQRVWHAPGGKARYEVIAPRQRAGELLVIDGQHAWHYDPRRREVHVLPAGRRGHGVRGRGKGMRGHWKIVARGEVAGRPCLVLARLRPDGSVGAKIWIDAATKLPVRGELYGPGGQLLEKWYYTEIDFHPRLRPELFSFRPPPGTRVVRGVEAARNLSLDEAERRLGMIALVPQWLPPGFKLLANRCGIVRRGDRVALWMVFSDGVRTFSIFQSRRLRPGPKPPGAAARWDIGPYTLLVVGRLSAEELEKMRKSIPAPPPGPQAPGPGRYGGRR